MAARPESMDTLLKVWALPSCHRELTALPMEVPAATAYAPLQRHSMKPPLAGSESSRAGSGVSRSAQRPPPSSDPSGKGACPLHPRS